MAQDSLSKKTYLGSAMYLFANRENIWNPDSELDLVRAARVLASNEALDLVLGQRKWPKDPRAKQAYIHRFFTWLQLEPQYQSLYPTVVLSADDSFAFRQCLWLDFYFHTPGAREACAGLYQALTAPGVSLVEISSATQGIFSAWLGFASVDSTVRTAFSRWLEDAGLGYAKPERRDKTSIFVSLQSRDYVTSEAFAYGLFLEYGDADAPSPAPVVIASFQIPASQTVKALLLSAGAVPLLLDEAVAAGYATRRGASIVITLASFAEALKRHSPFPAQSWDDGEASADDPLSREAVEKLRDFTADNCHVTSGSPFVNEAETEIERSISRKRESAFSRQVSAAYRYRCCISGLRFRSPSGRKWHGNAAHIVPHEGKDKQSRKVYGASAVSNGLFLSQFIHWCFDQGWLTLVPVWAGNDISGYKVEVATVAAEPLFNEEANLLLRYDQAIVPATRLPENRNNWPSLVALDWHHENVFEG